MHASSQNKRFSFVAAFAVLAFCFMTAQLSAMPTHHMDPSDCAQQVSCSHCFVPGSIDMAEAKRILPFHEAAGEALNFFEPYVTAPAAPPPKQ